MKHYNEFRLQKNILKVIVTTIVIYMYNFQSVTIQEIHANKYKNAFQQPFDQNIPSRDIFILTN